MTDNNEPGITLEHLPRIYREGYLQAIEMARGRHDPATDWNGFREYLWAALIPVFGLDPGDPCPDGMPRAHQPATSGAGTG